LEFFVVFGLELLEENIKVIHFSLILTLRLTHLILLKFLATHHITLGLLHRSLNNIPKQDIIILRLFNLIGTLRIHPGHILLLLLVVALFLLPSKGLLADPDAVLLLEGHHLLVNGVHGLASEKVPVIINKFIDFFWNAVVFLVDVEVVLELVYFIGYFMG
jgi:hypothetical protein